MAKTKTISLRLTEEEIFELNKIPGGSMREKIQNLIYQQKNFEQTANALADTITQNMANRAQQDKILERVNKIGHLCVDIKNGE